MAKKCIIAGIIAALFIIGYAFIFDKTMPKAFKETSVECSLPETVSGTAFIVIKKNDYLAAAPYIQALADELNKTGDGDGAPFLLYSGKFNKAHEIEKLPCYDSKAVLLLGSSKLMKEDYEALKNYGTILTTSGEYVRPNAFFFPLPYIDDGQVFNQEEPLFYALINKPSMVKELLDKKGLKYREYSTDKKEEIYKDLPHFKAIFAADTGTEAGAFDLSPLFLNAMAKGILLIGSPYLDSGVSFSFLGDYATYYLNDIDLATTIDLIEKNDAKFVKRAEDAAIFAKNVLEVKPQALRMKEILLKRKAPKINIFSDINIDTVGVASDYSCGDYWLGHDLGALFSDRGANVNYSYRDSMFFLPSKINIVVRGRLDKVNHGEKNILWLVYFQALAQGRNAKTIDSIIEYAKGFDAVATGSLFFYKLLGEKGIKVSYIPQFTNTKKFYPDYDENLKSEILFVGKNLPYRRAAHWALKHKLPITIYGPAWPEGTFKATYADNRILRKYYSSAKIVLNDAQNGMKDYGFIINRIFDVTAAGGFVISDYMKEIEEIYGDTVPMWKTEEEFVALVNYYLDPEHEEERLDKARRAREITLLNFSDYAASEKFFALIESVLEKDF